MKFSFTHPPSLRFGATRRLSPRASRLAPRFAFTLVEMMITTGLLGFIVLGLTAMFVQTQKAFRAGTAQTDVLESGRAVTDLLSRELEGITPSGLGQATNFSMAFETFSTVELPGGNPKQYRTNVLQYFFTLSEYNQKWKGVGYVVAFPRINPANNQAIYDWKVGSLYRWQYPTNADGAGMSDPMGLITNFINLASDAVNYGVNPTNTGNLVRVSDGIIHLRVLAYDNHGILISTNDVCTDAPYQNNDNIRLTVGKLSPGHLEVKGYTFTSKAVPAYLDLELGVLEPDVWERFKSIPNDSVARQYLARQAGHLHVFRRRIAIHNVDAGLINEV